MKNSIYPCLIIKGKIAEASDYYMQAFGEGTLVHSSSLVKLIDLSGQRFMLLNDGPTTSPTPAISFMVVSETAEETEKYWNKLIAEGKALMPLDSYDWSPKYGWVEDKFGVSWQLYTGSKADTPQKFSPTFMFTGANTGKTQAAIDLYTRLFPDSTIQGVMKYTKEEGENPDLIKHAQFKINDFTMMAMDSSYAHGFNFTDAISIVVACETQDEIDKYWSELTANGGKEVACGWLTDPYGISWQIVPANILKLVTDPERSQRVMNAVMKMKKLIIADLENA
ncbi:VOC family protein [Pedobacter caeni]|uniref:Glyoxalase superfamily enzyme, possibly 3-demethylubiquinone-9 3-methyltransferase n=1 Tax=Pedobacter caeni TaxID=288992 RepID=A0A1M4U864_9SPHI|nr:VOC family protein [Pedobacter caeni]SHE53061.1 Glyoxalase superfamily enzyme, possibly 3-demethylubiquinone-9 3-methyltransferase [Pedobacter caeni]